MMQISALNKRLFLIFITLLFFNTLIIFYSNSIDDFAPESIGVALGHINGLTDSSETFYRWFMQIPGYNTLLVELLLLLKIDPYILPTSMIEFIPLLSCFFCLIYVLSHKNYLLSLLSTFFMFSLGNAGTYKFYIWPHALGVLLFTLILLNIYYFIKFQKKEFLIILIVLSISLPYVSYNLTYLVLWVFISIIFLNFIFNSKKPVFSKNLPYFSIILIIMIIEFSLSEFVYSTFLPTLFNQDFSSMDRALEIFMQYFFKSSNYQDIIIQELLISTPKIIPILHLIKYFIISFICFFSVLLLIFKYKYFKNRIEIIYIFIALATSVIIYTFSRLFIGQFTFSEIIYPFFLSIIIISLYKQNFKKYINLLLIILIIINLFTIGIIHHYQLVQKDDYSYLQKTGDWITTNIGSNSIYIPDQLTFSWIFIEDVSKGYPIQLKYMAKKDIVNIYKIQEIPNDYIYVINYRPSYNLIGGWDSTKSFKYFKDEIYYNPSIKSKIYTYNNDITIVIT